MKLIQMLVLATALALMAAAQNTGANSGPQAVKSPTPASTATSSTAKGPSATSKPGSQSKPTPATTGVTANAQGGTKTAAGTTAASKKAATKKATGVAAGAAKAGTQGAPGIAAPKKPPVAVGTLPNKATQSTKTAATKKATAKGPIRAQTKKGAPVTPKPIKPVVPAKAAPPVKAPPAKPEVPPVVAEKKPAPRLGANGRRDPFVSPIRAITSNGPGVSCTTGKRCLSIPEVVLQGTVKDISGKMMAVVVSSAHRTYTLRENDQVFNGSVEKITTDSIIFREFVKDALGHETAREVVKKLGPSS